MGASRVRALRMRLDVKRRPVTPAMRNHYDRQRSKRERKDALGAMRFAPLLAEMIARPLKG
jgi:hypothetical protein